MTQKDQNLILGEIINRCWDDAAYKARFLKNPNAVLKDAGFPVGDKNFRVVENTADVHYIVLPEKPSEKISDEELDGVAGGIQIIDRPINKPITYGAV